MHDHHWNLLAKYLAGECTDEEVGEVERWLAEKPEHEHRLAELEEIWGAAEPTTSEYDVEGLWNRLQRHVEEDDPGRRRAADRSAAPGFADRDRPRRNRGLRQRSARRASRRLVSASAFAVVLLLGVLALVLWTGEAGLRDSPDQQGTVFTTERGQRATVRLVDGSIVQLNAASTLTVSPSFGSSERVVRLEGEAYFKVAHDSTRPFVVRTGRASVHVLGTEFNVTDYREEAQVQVAVADGQVAFRPAQAEGETSAVPDAGDVVLSARQMAELRDGGELLKKSIELEPHIAWMDGYLHFQNAPFEEVVRRLSRYYNVDIDGPETVVPTGHLNARFSDEQSLTEVLGIISTVFDVRFVQSDSTVRFYSPSHSQSAVVPPSPQPQST